MGVVSALCSGFLENLAETVLKHLVSPSSPIYVVLLAFLVVAVVEEGTKFWLLKRCTWNHPAFNYRFDGIVYAGVCLPGLCSFREYPVRAALRAFRGGASGAAGSAGTHGLRRVYGAFLRQSQAL